MQDVLPSQSGLAINGLIYQYSVGKEINDDFEVTIRNEHAYIPNEYVLNQTDDWSGLPGSTINKRLSFPDTSATLYGKGEIVTDGVGTVSNPSVVYEYRFDECYNPLYDPSCPGYYDALYAFLKEQGLLDREPDINDPFYDEWVQYQLSLETDTEEEEIQSEEEEESSEEIEQLNGGASLEAITGAVDQTSIMIQLAQMNKIDAYIIREIPGGVYEESIKLQDTTLPDNNRAMKNLASDAKHRTMVRSQYGE